MEDAKATGIHLAQQVLPAPLLQALKHIFSKGLEHTWLVGGTALAGFYAGHRRSDDLDLFVSADAFAQTHRAVQSLKTELGAELSNESRTPMYYRGTCALENHVTIRLFPSCLESFSDHRSSVLFCNEGARRG